MTPFEDSDSENEIQSDSWPLDDSTLEIQSQLESDALHLAELYPPSDSNQLDHLINRCLVVSRQTGVDEFESASSSSDERLTVSGKPDKRKNKSRNKSARQPSKLAKRWTHVATALCIGVMLVSSIAYLWNQPSLEVINEPVVSIDSEPEFDLVPAVSVSTLPAEFLNASEPELEAIYDEMPSESICIEF